MSVETLARGRYAVERVLGHGGMAIVYLARDVELERPVAVKLLADNLAADEAFRERFVREAKVAARLAHPNIVGVFDTGEDEDGRPYIVMEYVDGRTLADVLAERGRLPADEVVRIAVQACAGLERAHDAGLVHRDVKPGNLLLREDGILKIADFGIARAAETTRLTELGTVLGTASYLAPEQAAGKEVTAAADIYSLGVVLYEALTGRPPYNPRSLPELAVQQQRGSITPPRELEPSAPPAVEAAVMRALARAPEQRPASAAELARELDGGAAAPQLTGGHHAAPDTDATQIVAARRRATRPWRWIALAAAALAAAAAVGLVVATRNGDADRPPPAAVEPVPRATQPAQQARNLARWLREQSR